MRFAILAAMDRKDAHESDHYTSDSSKLAMDAVRTRRRGRPFDQVDVSLGDTCAMMLSVSDNTVANIELAELGGPEGLTAFLQSIGHPAQCGSSLRMSDVCAWPA